MRGGPPPALFLDAVHGERLASASRGAEGFVFPAAPTRSDSIGAGARQFLDGLTPIASLLAAT